MTHQLELLSAAVETLSQAVALRDTYTGEHSRRVTLFALILAKQMCLPANELELIRLAAPLHDIGKISIADAILRKPDSLTAAEFDIMKTHALRGAEMIEPIPDLHDALPLVRSHHERWDGEGYPDGLAGDSIPRLARIVAVADAFDAMVFATLYRRAQPVEIAFAEIERQKGKQFDPEAVDAFMQVRQKVVKEMACFEKASPADGIGS